MAIRLVSRSSLHRFFYLQYLLGFHFPVSEKETVQMEDKDRKNEKLTDNRCNQTFMILTDLCPEQTEFDRPLQMQTD